MPDVMFVQAERLKALADSDPEWDTTPLPFAPDLAVEVMSLTDRFATVSKKARGYLKDGVQMVWVIDPERRAIFIYTPDNPQATPLSEDDKLLGNEIIPGFELDIAKLFE